MLLRRMRNLLSLLAAVLLFSGCPKDPYRAALSASDDVANAVASTIKVSSDYYGAGKLNDNQKKEIADILTQVTNSNLKFRHGADALRAQGVVGKAAYLALATEFVNSVPIDPTAYHYFSKDSQVLFYEVLNSVKIALNGITLAIQQAKGK